MLDCAQKISTPFGSNYFTSLSKTHLLLKYCFGARGVKFLEKRRENVQILQALK
jgi:hypothetical protein